MAEGLSRTSLLATRGLSHDFGANPVSGKNLQKERMRNPAVNQVHFRHAMIDGYQRRLHLRDHATFDDSILSQLADSSRIKSRYQGSGVFDISHYSQDIADVDHLRCFYRAR